MYGLHCHTNTQSWTATWLYGVFQQMFSHVFWRGILAMCLRWKPHLNFVSHLCACVRDSCVCARGSICTCVVMDGMCDMCHLSGMPGTSGVLNTGPAPIEMAYQWRYIWKNSLPMQSLTTPVRRRRRNPYHAAPRLPLYSLPPSLSSPSALYLCLVLEIC